MANTFQSYTSAGVGTTETTVLTAGASAETTIVGLSVSNRESSQVLVDVLLDGSARTSGAVDSVYLIKNAPVPVGSSLVVVGGDQKVVLEPGDVIKVTSDLAASADILISTLERS